MTLLNMNRNKVNSETEYHSLGTEYHILGLVFSVSRTGSVFKDGDSLTVKRGWNVSIARPGRWAVGYRRVPQDSSYNDSEGNTLTPGRYVFGKQSNGFYFVCGREIPRDKQWWAQNA
jgi:hypothetical protein